MCVPFVFAGDRLIAGGQVDDAEPRMPEGNAAVGRDPMALPVGAAMIEALGGPLAVPLPRSDHGARTGRQFRTF